MSRRVLHVLSQRAGWTGSGVALHALVQAAAACGWEQAVILADSPDQPTPVVGDLPKDAVFPLTFEQPPLPFPIPGMSDVMPYASSRFSQMSPRQLEQYRTAWHDHVTRVVQVFRPDLIHSHHIWLLSSLLKSVAGSVPVVTHCHGTGLRQAELCSHLADVVRDGCRRNDAFFALHAAHADAIAKQLEISADRIHVIGSGYRPDLFHAEGRDPQGGSLVYAGKLSRAKGLPWLLDAFERVRASRPESRLHIAGSGSGAEAEALRARLQEMSQVEFHGQLDQTELARLLRRAEAFVLPSLFEGLPLVLVEAAACGCRLISTALPGVVQQLAPVLGEAIETVEPPGLRNVDQPVEQDLPAFVERLAAAIERTLQRPPLPDPQARVAAWTWDAIFAKIERVWRSRIAAAAT